MRRRTAGLVAFGAMSLAVIGAAYGAPPATAPVLAFTGLDSSQLPGANPADVQVAAGPGGVVEMVNSSAGLWSVSGTQAQSRGTLTLGEIFSGGGVDRSKDDTTDPRILYDPPSGRFFGAMFDITRRETDFGVTAGGDPAGSRYVVGLASPGCPDQPRLGVSSRVVVLTDDLFTSCRSSGRFMGGEIVVVSKDELLAGTTPRFVRFGPSAAFSAITPAASLTPSATAYLVSVSEDGTKLGIIRVTGPGVSSLPLATVRLARKLRAPPPARQLGSTAPIDTGDIRIQDAYMQGGAIWLTASEACPSAVTRSCGRIIAVDPAAARVLVDRTLTPAAGRSLYYPALAPDSRGNVVLAYEYSSVREYPSFAYAYLRPDGVFGAPADVVRGSAPNTSTRFGDYSGAAPDPVDPSRIWIAGEIGSAVGGSTLGWSTGVVEVSVPPQAPAVLLRTTTRRATSASISASVYPEAGATTYRVQYGTTKATGRRAAAGKVPGTALAKRVTVGVGGLRGGRTYYFRIFATNSEGTVRTAVQRIPSRAGAKR